MELILLQRIAVLGLIYPLYKFNRYCSRKRKELIKAKREIKI